MANEPGQDETIKVKRRRQGASSGPQGSGRADMPSRDRPGGGGPRIPTGGGSSGGSFGGGGGNITRLPILLVILLFLGYFLFNTFFGGSESKPPDAGLPEGPTAAIEQETEAPVQAARPTARPTRTPVPEQTTAPQPAQGATTGQTWTVMLYQDADDQILEQDIYLDLNEAERVGSSDRVQIVAQIDRYKGAFNGDRNWTSTRRYHITEDHDLQQVNSELVDDLGELNMADGNTLEDFVVWAASAYPADKYILILSDHGMGWPGGFSDNDPPSRDSSRAPLVSAIKSDQLYLMELENTLANSLQKANIEKFEIIGMDACLMAHLEVLSALEPYSQYAVLSQETEPALGWAYTGFMQALVDNPDISGAQLSEQIVRTYIRDDMRINDDEERAAFLRQGSPMSGLFGSSSQISAASLAAQIERDVTLTAVDLSAVPDLIDSVNRLAFTMQSDHQEIIASARTYAPAFTNVFGGKGPSPYIDLGGFAQMLKREGANDATSQAADRVLSRLNNAVIAERHGDGKKGSTGVSIYFPNSSLYRSPLTGPESYTAIADRFAQESLWDDFLAYHYNNIAFEAEPAQPVSPQPSGGGRAPGQGQIQVSPIQLSSKVAAPNQPTTLTTRVSGKNIGYIYYFAGYYDANANAIFKADTDYLESPQTQELNGVFYPQWNGDNAFNLEFEWEPTLFQITDGENSSVAMFTPQTYGASAQDAVYTMDGTYHYADGTSRSARLYFRDGILRQVFGFTDADQTGGVREIIPQPGDSFTLLENWLDLNSSGQVEQTSTENGATLTFGSQPFRWEEVYAAPGDYVLGIIVQDLDGNSQAVYTKVTVQ